jgi:hypothetical protein
MATIKKNRARTFIANGAPTSSISNFASDGGLRFRIQIGEHTVSLTHVERDQITKSWARAEVEYES